MKPTILGLLSLVVLSLAAGQFADRILAGNFALTPTLTGGTGHQIYDNVFGEDFNTLQPIRVQSLAVFDNGKDGVLNTDSPTQPIVIQLWNRDTETVIASENFAGGAGDGTAVLLGTGQVFSKDLAVPLILPAGGHYYISEDFSGHEGFGNVNTGQDSLPTVNDGGGAIAFGTQGRAAGAHNYFFDGVTNTNGFFDGPTGINYTGPNFFFTAVPEPSTGLMLVVGAAALGSVYRRRPK